MVASQLLEVTVQDLTGMSIALAGGAGRVELCTALGVAGLTPSIGLIEGCVEAARDAGAVGFVDVLIRPREGDFVYDASELATAERDVRRAVAAGVDGVVIGATTRDGRIDLPATRQLMEAAEGVNLVFHRAFDMVADQGAALEQLVELGFLRVLTSGGAPVCGEGVDALRSLVQRSAGRIQIMAGGGARLDDIPELIDAGVDAIHMSTRRSITGGPARPGAEPASHLQPDPELLRAAVAAIRTASGQEPAGAEVEVMS